jgi:hypothetical protein
VKYLKIEPRSTSPSLVDENHSELINTQTHNNLPLQSQPHTCSPVPPLFSIGQLPLDALSSTTSPTVTESAKLATPDRCSWESNMQDFGMTQEQSKRMQEFMMGRVQGPTGTDCWLLPAGKFRNQIDTSKLVQCHHRRLRTDSFPQTVRRSSQFCLREHSSTSNLALALANMDRRCK